MDDSRAGRVRGAVINKNAGTRGIYKGARTHAYTPTRVYTHTHTRAHAQRPGGGGGGGGRVVEGPAQRARIHHPLRGRTHRCHRVFLHPCPHPPGARDKIDHRQSSSTLPPPTTAGLSPPHLPSRHHSPLTPRDRIRSPGVQQHGYSPRGVLYIFFFFWSSSTFSTARGDGRPNGYFIFRNVVVSY